MNLKLKIGRPKKINPEWQDPCEHRKTIFAAGELGEGIESCDGYSEGEIL